MLRAALLIGEETEYATAREFPLGQEAEFKSHLEWHRLKEDWEWVLMGSLEFWSLMTAADAVRSGIKHAERLIRSRPVVGSHRTVIISYSFHTVNRCHESGYSTPVLVSCLCQSPVY